jgi:hypothetical protein
MSEYDYSMFPGWREVAADAEAQEVLRRRAETETMTPRERFHAAMRFEEVDRLPTTVMGLWPETLERWRAEGMSSLAAEMVRFDAPLQSCWLYGRYQGPIPAFDEELLAETDRYRDSRNYLGQTQRAFRGATAIPAFLEYPIKGRADWESYKKRFDPSSAGRLPPDWDQLVAERKGPAASEVRGLAVWGYFGFPREMLGVERLSMLFHDDPALLADMNEFWCDYTIRRLSRAVDEMEFDYALIWEDNCYNHGMLHSPQVFQQFMAPHYRRLVDFFRTHHIDNINVDSDGNVNKLIPLLLDVGVTGMHPFEVASGMDVVEIGKKYPQLQIWAGLDKRAIAKGRDAIDAELDRVIPAMKRRGGYAAGLDHNVPPDISLADHRYYAETLRRKAK